MPTDLALVVLACLASNPNVCATWDTEIRLTELQCNFGGGQQMVAEWMSANHPDYVISGYGCPRNQARVQHVLGAAR